MWPKWLLFIFVHIIIDFIYPLWLHFVPQRWCRLFSKACHMCIISKLLCVASLTMTKCVGVRSNLPSQPSSRTTHFPLWFQFNRYLIYFKLRLTVLQEKNSIYVHAIDFSGGLFYNWTSILMTASSSLTPQGLKCQKSWSLRKKGLVPLSCQHHVSNLHTLSLKGSCRWANTHTVAQKQTLWRFISRWWDTFHSLHRVQPHSINLDCWPFSPSDASHHQHIGWYLKVVPDVWSNLKLKSEKWSRLLWHHPHGSIKMRPFLRDSLIKRIWNLTGSSAAI